MPKNRMLTRAAGVTVALGGATLALAGPASAHVTISPDGTEANSYTVATVSVPHGCNGSATTQVTIQIPKDLIEVTPTRNALWNVTKTMTKLATPIKAEDGDAVTEKVDTVTYTAKTPLPDGYRDGFELSFQVPDKVGTTLTFPTIQKCVTGETDWIEVAAAGAAEPEHPAPSFVITAAGAAGEASATANLVTTAARTTTPATGSDTLGIIGLVAGLLGLGAGGAALARTRKA